MPETFTILQVEYWKSFHTNILTYLVDSLQDFEHVQLKAALAVFLSYLQNLCVKKLNNINMF